MSGMVCSCARRRERVLTVAQKDWPYFGGLDSVGKEESAVKGHASEFCLVTLHSLILSLSRVRCGTQCECDQALTVVLD